MEKIIITFWSIWNYRNYNAFTNKKSNPMNIIEQARNNFHGTFYQNQSNNLVNQVVLIERYKCKRNEHVGKDRWTTPVESWIERNTDASNIESRKSTTIVIVCKDNRKRICYEANKHIGYCFTLLSETMTIKETIIETIKIR